MTCQYDPKQAGRSVLSFDVQPPSSVFYSYACLPMQCQYGLFSSTSSRHMQSALGRNSCFLDLPLLHGTRTIFTSSIHYEPKTGSIKPGKVWPDEDKSKVEETLEAIKEKKEKLKEKAFLYGSTPEELESKAVVAPPKKALWQTIKDEVIHYYNGFRLLYLNVKIAARLQWQVLNGKSLSRRERKQVSKYGMFSANIFTVQCSVTRL